MNYSYPPLERANTLRIVASHVSRLTADEVNMALAIMLGLSCYWCVTAVNQLVLSMYYVYPLLLLIIIKGYNALCKIQVISQSYFRSIMQRIH